MVGSYNDVLIEVYGIVYIYNPVNPKALQSSTPDASAGDASGGLTADAASPAAPS
jgi:hypothetical protein